MRKRKNKKMMTSTITLSPFSFLARLPRLRKVYPSNSGQQLYDDLTQKQKKQLSFLHREKKASARLFLLQNHSGSASDTASSDGNGSAFDSTSTPALCATYPLISRL